MRRKNPNTEFAAMNEHLHVPDSETKTYGDRAFCFSGPREWNKLSLEIRQSKSMEVFKTNLKTLLFK